VKHRPMYGCPIDGCRVEVNRAQRVCPQHWRRIPDSIRGQIMGARTPTEREEALSAARRALDRQGEQQDKRNRDTMKFYNQIGAATKEQSSE
jgi:GTP cyclohydrolase III